nr:protein NRT1/ PTR FAMILY 5.5-like [Ipomoea batatas]
MSTPPVLSNFAGNCSRYEAECVGPIQKAFFFTSLVLMGVGMAGKAVSLDAYLRRYQTPGDDNSNDLNNQQVDDEEEDGFWSVNNLLVIGISVVAALALSNIKPWDIKFAVPAVFSFTATLVFFAGKELGFYSNYGDKPEGSALTTVVRVLVAATYKSCHKLPANSAQLYQGNHNSAERLTHTDDGCGCFDKAAIESPTKRAENKWKAAKMNHNIGKWQFPTTILLLLPKAAKYATLAACKYAFKSTRLKLLAESSEFGSMIGPIYAMINTVMCCLFATLVETARRHHIDHDETMSIFWLIPQFYALINVDATFHESVKAFFKNNAAPSMKEYALHLTQFVWGIGEALSLVSVLACKKWFNNDVDQSRLDKYYWTLTALTALAFICYLLLVIRSLVRLIFQLIISNMG